MRWYLPFALILTRTVPVYTLPPSIQVLFFHILVMSVLGETYETGAGMTHSVDIDSNGSWRNWWQAIVLYDIVAINQSYFMGLFFAFSGYFVPRSFDRKGIEAFLHERFIRLGIPFTLYFTLLGPVSSGWFRSTVVWILLHFYQHRKSAILFCL